ncbi:hypothetical protein K5V21_12910 [Clostridium sardiniense]|uniref:Lipoprotein n=1 Tax=Clostridium sardiniense TaxID=29369 RepID=A0ABS7KZZ5_CLOSR|nr:hypothetical protein [Clostridium sardiniense]MBY0756349.1 hypothetical protein [Clostridium sardiniense]MDQ0461506.1 hypothetical protein [Clostridium sardiniense]
MKRNLRIYVVVALFLGASIALIGCGFHVGKVISVEGVNKASGMKLFIEDYNKDYDEFKKDKGNILNNEIEKNPTLKITYEGITEDARLIMYSQKKSNVKIIKEESDDIIRGKGLPVYKVSPEEELKLNFSEGGQKYIGFCVLDGDKGVDLDERMFATKDDGIDYIRVPERKGNYIMYIFSGWEDAYTIYGIKLEVQ